MFKKIGIRTAIVTIVIGLCAVGFAIDKVYMANVAGEKVNPGELHTDRSAWEVIGATTSAGDEPNDLTVAERTYATVLAAAEGGDDKIIIFDLRTAERLHWNRMRLRCIGITDGGNVVYETYLGTLGVGGTDCILAPAGELDFTIGTQASTTSTYEVADTLAITSRDSWTKSWRSASPENNRVAEGWLDLNGADVAVFVPKTVGCDAKLLGKGF